MTMPSIGGMSAKDAKEYLRRLEAQKKATEKKKKVRGQSSPEIFETPVVEAKQPEQPVVIVGNMMTVNVTEFVRDAISKPAVRKIVETTSIYPMYSVEFDGVNPAAVSAGMQVWLSGVGYVPCDDERAIERWRGEVQRVEQHEANKQERYLTVMGD